MASEARAANPHGPGFSLTPTEKIYRAEGDGARPEGQQWDPGQLLPHGPVSFDPAAACFSYGLGVFEGLKAYRRPDGAVQLFRVEDNAARFRRSAEQLLLPPYPARRFVEAVERLVRANLRFVPEAGQGTLYVRPVELASEPRLGIGPCQRVTVLIYCSPVKSYFADDGLRLRVVRRSRVPPESSGSAKAMGNYAGCLATVQRWRGAGYGDVLFLDARERRLVTETSGSNLFALLRDGTLVTPPLDDQILQGITRDSVIRLARERLGLEVYERPLPLEELLEQAEELFCTGTAYTVRAVTELHDGEHVLRLPRQDTAHSLGRMLLAIQHGEQPDPFGWTREL